MGESRARREGSETGITGGGSGGTCTRSGSRLYEVRVRLQHAHPRPVPSLAGTGFLIGLQLPLATGPDSGTVFKRQTYTSIEMIPWPLDQNPNQTRVGVAPSPPLPAQIGPNGPICVSGNVLPPP
ncbi:hypothetical protein NITHO_2220002 [Nitrolancea hollandica Lb]|uniref:Uncharacterized protein n=1 Tax=Nitrolancea hollandica Lb TaxID=1129897 RepID=I4EF74_9BACT|nr:hypothetical protein NITHO_2220002 [Nitrolancea hollandica Lb]